MLSESVARLARAVSLATRQASFMFIRVEVGQKDPIVTVPPYSAVPASWINATFLTIVSG